MNEPTAEELELAADVSPEAVRDIERAQARQRRRDFPKPTEQDILELKEDLEGIWHEWRYGAATDTDGDRPDFTPTEGIPGALRIRAMRYHRDRMPAKWLRVMRMPYRWRGHRIANECERIVALATRNNPKIEIKPSKNDPDALDAADRETRWAQSLIPSLERQASQALIRQFSDAVVESGMGVFEVFLTDAYDDIDIERRDGETDEDYAQRTNEELVGATAERGLPVGVRVIDPLTALPRFDDKGLSEIIIVERMPYRHVYRALRDTLSDETLTELSFPKPGDTAWPALAGFDARYGTPNGEVETIRHYNRHWYTYMVAGKIIDIRPHGWPKVPVIVAAGNTSGSKVLSERFQGVVWGMVEQEQALNDYITRSLDIEMTYGPPKTVVETAENAQLRSPNQPQTIDLSDPNVAVELMPGQRIADAFAGFRNRLNSPVLGVMVDISQQSGLSPIASGESPGSDPSGFAVNTLQASSQMRYEILFDNIGRGVGMLIDLIRQGVKHGPIADDVFVPVETKDGLVEYLGLGPDDISSMPSSVYIDPMNDVNRLANRQSLIAGNQAGYVPRRIVQTQGYGAEDPEAWDNLIAIETADMQMLGLAIEQAKMRTIPQARPQLVGPNGEPITSGRRAGDDDELERLGGIPFAPRGEAGRMGREAGNPVVNREEQAFRARARGGQQPAWQGTPQRTEV